MFFDGWKIETQTISFPFVTDAVPLDVWRGPRGPMVGTLSKRDADGEGAEHTEEPDGGADVGSPRQARASRGNKCRGLRRREHRGEGGWAVHFLSKNQTYLTEINQHGK